MLPIPVPTAKTAGSGAFPCSQRRRELVHLAAPTSSPLLLLNRNYVLSR
jgi:hypothetical protein